MVERGLTRPQPAAQILSLALLTILLARIHFIGLLIVAGPLIWMLAGNPRHLSVIFRLVVRLRWFFLSILVLYTWFTPALPGEPLQGGISSLMPGLIAGSERILALVIIVGYAGLLLLFSSRDEIIGGIYTLLTPMKWLGIEPERLAVRLGLVLGYVPGFEAMQKQAADDPNHQENQLTWLDRLTRLYQAAESGDVSTGREQETGAINLPHKVSVGMMDILLPGTLLVLLVYV